MRKQESNGSVNLPSMGGRDAACFPRRQFAQRANCRSESPKDVRFTTGGGGGVQNSLHILAVKYAVLAAVLLGACAVIFAGCSPDDEDNPPVKLPMTWTLGSGIDSDVTINKVAYGNNVFVAAGKKGSEGYAAVSENGVTWTTATDTTAFEGSSMHVSFQNDVFIAYGGSSGNKNWAKSSDGTTWAAIGDETSNFNAKGGTFGNGNYLMSGSAGRIAHSSDGTTWTIVANTETTFGSGPAGFINAVAYGNGKFVAGGGNGHAAWASQPTEQWEGVTQTETIFDNGFINALIFADFDGGRFVAVGGQDSGTGKAAYSKDGVSWTQTEDIKIGDSTMVNSIAYGGGVFVAADKKGNASYSTDGTTWTLIANTQFSSDTTAINSICYGKGKFVIAGSGRIAYSMPE
ncbi:MAG: hypothetical protein LBG72_10470 [Spirochaetaceae bacterium]|jgi:hypothetical protein|nr:hypothetical protein [Spirochaetaceae bacterium]